MASKIERRGVSVFIDGSQIPNSVKAIRKEYQKLIRDQDDMTMGSIEYNLQTRKIAQLNSIIKQHKDYQAEVAKEYSKMSGAADDFEKKSKKAFSLDSIASGLNKLKGAIAGFIASFTVDKAIDEFAKLDAAQANVQKYTGLTRKKIKELNKEFDLLDTRTASIRLNELAGDAGRLGKQSRKDILDFVDAGNIIDVALGEDLGEGAIKSIGKLAQMFGDADRMGLKQAMLATGSAINEVAQNSSAAEPYLVDFTNRLSGVGNQAGFSISQIIGLGSVLDQNAQQVETSATALSGLIMKIYQEPAKFAKIAGLDVKNFSDLMKKDANEALLTLLDTLGKQGGLDKLAPIFKDMNLNGARSSSILSVLAGNIEQVRNEQKTATEAFLEGKSVINEYDVQNNTFSANLEKQKKVLLGYITDIGEKLAPMVLEGASAGNILLKVFTSLISILIDNKEAILTVVGAYLAYNVALKAQIAYQTVYNSIATLSRLITLANAGAKAIETGNTVAAAKAQKLYYTTLEKGNIVTRAYLAVTALLSAAKAVLTGNLVAARVAMVQFSTAVAMNPVGAALTAIVALGYGFVSLYQKLRDNNDEYKRSKALIESTKEETKKYIDEISNEERAFNSLMIALINTNEKSALRKSLINDLKTQYPQFLKYINLEVMSNKELESVLKGVNSQYEKRYEIAAYKGRMDADGKLITDMKNQQITIKEELERLNSVPKNVNNINRIKELETQYESLEKQIGKAVQKVGKYQEEITKIETNIASENTVEGIWDMIEAKTRDLEANKEFLLSVSLSPESKKRISNEIKVLETDIEVLKKKSNSIGAELSNEQTPETPPSAPSGDGKGDKKNVQREKMNNALRKIETAHQTEMTAIKNKYLNGELTSEEAYNEEVLKQQDKFDKKRKEKLQQLQKELSDPSLKIDIGKQIAEIDSKALDRQIADRAKKQKDAIKQEQDLLKWNEEETKKIIEDAFKFEDNLEDKALIQLMEKRSKNLISDAQYQKEYRDIELKHLEERLRINGLTEEQIADIRKQILDQEINTLQAAEDKRRSLLGDDIYLQLTDQMKSIDDALLSGAVTFGEAIMLRVESYLNAANTAVQSIGGNLSNAMTNFASAEESAVSRKYDKQIAAAEGNSKKQKKLEEQKQKDLNAIKAKYADKQFAVTVAQTISSTAVAAMEAYKAMAGIPVVGPALGVAAAGAALAYGASQIAVAKEQRDAAKEGYFDGGFTGGVDPKQIRGYLPDGSPVHGKEFVANRHLTANPQILPALNLFDEAQKHGTAGSLTKSDLAKALNIPMNGYMQGGFTGSPAPVYQGVKDDRYDQSYDRFVDVLDRLEERLGIPFTGVVKYKGTDGIEEAQDLNDKIMKNVSR